MDVYELNEVIAVTFPMNIWKMRVFLHPLIGLLLIIKTIIDNNEVEVVDDYTYLGVIFNYDGSFKKAVDKQITQARKAMFSLIEKAKILKLPIDLTCDLFDKTVLPVLIYGCEIWGFVDLRDVEIFYRKFLRILLKTYNFTPNCMLYGEFGTTDINTKVLCRMIMFWAK